MADADQKTDNAAQPAGKGSVLPWLLVGMGAGVVGAALPIGLTLMAGTDKPAVQAEHKEVKKSDKEMAYVPAGAVTVNLNDQRMGRYMMIEMCLYVRKDDEKVVTEALAAKEKIIRDWLVNHLSDKSLEDVRGAAGQNMVRREIRDYFNQTLLTDSYDHVYDVLFTDFKIQ